MVVNNVPRVTHRFVEVGGVRVFYREAGPQDAPTMLLLHGFPSGSHQFRRLIDALGGRYRLIAPDYPGFGHSDAPESATVGGPFAYTFERLADVIEGFCERLGLERFVMYVFDFGAPVGFRLATRHPEWIAGLVVQNGNAYDEGLSAGARQFVALRPDVEGDEEKVRGVLTLGATRGQYVGGATDPELIAPDGWTLDQHFLDLPGRKQIQVDLAFDYHTNVELYPRWQAWLREHRPPTLIAWGRHDFFFPEPGARAYLRDLPDAELHLFDTGHFALEENLPEVAPLIAAFLDRTWSSQPSTTKGSTVTHDALKIAIIGASGHIGRVVAQEALSRGHEVTAIARDPSRLEDLDGAAVASADILDPDDIEGVVAGHDAVIASVKGRDGGQLETAPEAARVLLDVLPRAGVSRLLFVGGGGSLKEATGRRFVDSPQFPRQYKGEALAQADALATFRGSNSAVEWSYVSPPPVHLLEGEKTNKYRVQAGDLPVTDEQGESRITVADYASAIVDELERGAFIGERFTVAY